MAVATRSIGQVLEIVRAEFPDISISKIRYLESEGLLSPERDQPSGYRRYSVRDIERLRYILRTQRDQYLPLRVIRENLERMDQGLEPSPAEPVAAAPIEPPAEEPTVSPPEPSTAGRQRTMRLSRRQILEMSGLPEATFIELERQKMVVPRKGTVYFGRDALTVAIVARRLSTYGLDVRHLRLVYQAASQEAALIEQTVAPYLRQRANAQDIINDVMKLVVHAHVAVLQGLVHR